MEAQRRRFCLVFGQRQPRIEPPTPVEITAPGTARRHLGSLPRRSSWQLRSAPAARVGERLAWDVSVYDHRGGTRSSTHRAALARARLTITAFANLDRSRNTAWRRFSTADSEETSERGSDEAGTVEKAGQRRITPGELQFVEDSTSATNDLTGRRPIHPGHELRNDKRPGLWMAQRLDIVPQGTRQTERTNASNQALHHGQLPDGFETQPTGLGVFLRGPQPERPKICGGGRGGRRDRALLLPRRTAALLLRRHLRRGDGMRSRRRASRGALVGHRARRDLILAAPRVQAR